jgi:hypothetical protein
MTDTPQDTPHDDPSSPVDDVASEATTNGKGPGEETDEPKSSGSKPWWKFWR